MANKFKTKISLNTEKQEQITGDSFTFSGNTSFLNPIYYVNGLSGSFGKNVLITKDYVTGLTSTISNNYITGATNLGSGYGLFSGILNHNLQLKSLKGGTGITIISTSTGLTFNGATVGNYVSATTFNFYTGTTAPAQFQSHSSIVTFTGTTLPATYHTKSAFNSFTGTTLPANYQSHSSIVTLTGTTLPSTYLPISNPTYTGVLSLGALSFSDTGILEKLASNTNSFNQIIIQNLSHGANASSNYVVSNDIGTATSNYGEFGMNSSGYTGTTSFNIPNAVYLDSSNSDLVIGTLSNKKIYFVANNSTTNAMVITGTTTQINNLINSSGTTKAFGTNNTSIATTAFVNLQIDEAVQNLGTGSTGTITLDCSHKNFAIVLTGNITLDYTNLVIGREYTLRVQRSTNTTITWASGKWQSSLGQAPIPTNPTTNGSSPAKAVDLFTFKSLSGTKPAVVITPDIQDI